MDVILAPTGRALGTALSQEEKEEEEEEEEEKEEDPATLMFLQ